MKKALQGFWRGGLLGGLLGLLGGEVLLIGQIWVYFSDETSLIGSLFIVLYLLLVNQLKLVLPVLLGTVFGGVLGLPYIFGLHRLPAWVRMGISVTTAAVLPLMIVRSVDLPRYLNRFVDDYLYRHHPGWAIFEWVVYLFVAAVYGYSFNREKPSWPKFLRKKVKIEGAEVKQ